MNVLIIDPAQDNRWDEFVKSHRYGSIFLMTVWSEILKKSYSFKPYYIVVEDDGVIRAGMPFMKIDSFLTGKRLISLPRTSYCDPLVESEQDWTAILQVAREIVVREKLDYFEIKTQKNSQFLSTTELKYYDYFHNQILDLEVGQEKLWKNFHRTCVRQRIQRAQKNDVVVRVGDKLKDLATFYDLYTKTTQKHVAPSKPFRFFENLWEMLSPSNNIMLLLAEKDEKAAAAAIFFKFKETVIFEFLGLNYDFIEHSPGHLIVWEAIQVALSEGLRYLDFGLTEPDNIGLLNFKTRWGAEEKTLRFFYYPDVKGYKTFMAGKDDGTSMESKYLSGVKRKFMTYAAEKLYKHVG